MGKPLFPHVCFKNITVQVGAMPWFGKPMASFWSWTTQKAIGGHASPSSLVQFVPLVEVHSHVFQKGVVLPSPHGIIARPKYEPFSILARPEVSGCNNCLSRALSAVEWNQTQVGSTIGVSACFDGELAQAAVLIWNPHPSRGKTPSGPDLSEIPGVFREEPTHFGGCPLCPFLFEREVARKLGIEGTFCSDKASTSSYPEPPAASVSHSIATNGTKD